MVAVVPFAETAALTATSLPLSKMASPPLRTSWNDPATTVAGSAGSSKVTVTSAGTADTGVPSAGAIETTDIGLSSGGAVSLNTSTSIDDRAVLPAPSAASALTVYGPFAS